MCAFVSYVYCYPFALILLKVHFPLNIFLPFFQVHLQTQQQVTQRLSSLAVHVVRTQGVLALYNGLSASLMRQVSRCAGHHNDYHKCVIIFVVTI